MDATLDILKNFMPTQTLQWAGTHSTAWQDGTIQVIAYLEVRLGVTLSDMVQIADSKDPPFDCPFFSD